MDEDDDAIGVIGFRERMLACLAAAEGEDDVHAALVSAGVTVQEIADWAGRTKDMLRALGMEWSVAEDRYKFGEVRRR